MNQMTNMFQITLKDGINCLESGELEKAKIYAEFAKAMAMTGTVCVSPSDKGFSGKIVEPELATEVSTQPVEVAEEAIVDVKPQAESVQVAQPIKETQAVQENTPPVQATTEEKIDESIVVARNNLNNYMEMFDSEVIVSCLSDFSSNVLTSINDITDENVVAFSDYLDLLMKDVQAAE